MAGRQWTLVAVAAMCALVNVNLAGAQTPQQSEYPAPDGGLINRNHTIYRLIPEGGHMENIENSAIALCDKLRDKAIELVQHEGKEDLEGSLELMMFCSSILPGYARAGRWTVGLNLNQLSRHDLARQYYLVSIMIDKTNPSFHEGLGVTYMSVNNSTEGVKCFEEAARLRFNITQDAWDQAGGVRGFHLDTFRNYDEVGGFTTLNFLTNSYRASQRFHEMRHLLKLMVKFNTTDQNLYSQAMLNSVSCGDITGTVDAMNMIAIQKVLATQGVDDADDTDDDDDDNDDDGESKAPKEGLTLETARELYAKKSISILTSSLWILGTSMSDVVLRGEPDIVPQMNEFMRTYCDLDYSHLMNESAIPLTAMGHMLEQCLQKSNVLQELKDQGGDVNMRQHSGVSPLMQTAAAGFEFATKWLLENGAEVDATDDNGMTALHYAITRSHAHIIPLLVKAGADANKPATGLGNKTPVQLACSIYHPQQVLDVLSSFVQTDYQGDENDVDPYSAWCAHVGVSLKPIDTSKAPPEEVPAKSDNGGWEVEPDARAAEYLAGAGDITCDIDIRADLTAETFLKDYVALSKPVLIRNGLVNFKRAKRNLKRDKLLKNHGDVKVKVSDIPYASSYGGKGKQVSVAEYIDYMRAVHNGTQATEFKARQYIFENVSPSEQSDAQALANYFSRPPVMKNAVEHTPQPHLWDIGATAEFYLGPAMSGAPVHYHRSAWNILIYGKKRWFVFPQQYTHFTNTPIVDWLQNGYQEAKEKKQVLECIQYPGDIIYVPNHFGHGVLNLRESVGYASEFSSAETAFGVLHGTGVQAPQEPGTEKTRE
eukprot:TRINITY_DN419_c0_g1_i11.p1 TRINITY_DN419_c0_g1~~TRINITY_DN419_c0_g1_i11.p1  ORF type:complete len:825 (-),score=156.94 TRINITY_DN419_c0_g1_i11:157-2631(-)